MHKNHALLLLFISASMASLYAQEALIANAFNRTAFSLDGEWKIIIDPYENGYYNYRYEAFDLEEHPSRNAFFTNSRPVDKSDLIEYDFDTAESLQVPGDWNSQKEKLLYYEGSLWYRKTFNYNKKLPSNRVFVYFGAVNYEAEVYLNGHKLGTHTGGFTPFNFEVTPLLREKDNFLILKVDNKRKKEAVPTLNTDWWNYGGITRSVSLIETPETFIRDFSLQLNPDNNKQLLGTAFLDGPSKGGAAVSVCIPGLKLEKKFVASNEGVATIAITAGKIEYWSPDAPTLYKVQVAAGKDSMADDIGFRTIETRGTDILLNGKPIFLRGICIHEESPLTGGRANSQADADLLLGWARDLNCNYVRLAHYPHNEYMVRTADKLGILVWEENPVYWTIQWQNPATYANAEKQLTEAITRDKNRASVIIWSMANETPNSDARLAFLGKLAQAARSLDSTRLISAALEQSRVAGADDVRTIEDPFASVVDVLSFNQYVGWYDGLPAKAGQIRWEIGQNKPVIVSEFGAGAKFGFHADPLTRWSEEYQESLYQESLKMLDRINSLRGMSPWLLMDFRSPRRPLPKIQDGYNRKGLLDEHGNRKKAFYVLQKYYAQKAGY